MRRGSTSSGASVHTSASLPRRNPSQTIDFRPQLYARAEVMLAKLRRFPQIVPYDQLVQIPATTLPDHLAYSLDVTPQGLPLDPVTILRRLMCTAAPLMMLYNLVLSSLPPSPTKEMAPLQPCSIDDCTDHKKAKKAIYHFFEGCTNNLSMRPNDLFTLSQVFSNDLAGFMAVLHTMECLFMKLENPTKSGNALTGPYIDRSRSGSIVTMRHGSSGSIDGQDAPMISPIDSFSPINGGSGTGSSSTEEKHGRVVDELLATERKYVGDLERLLYYRDEMQKEGIPRETADIMVPHVQLLLEFQQRFLVGCEHQARLFPDRPREQNFGWLFLHLMGGFEVYTMYTLSHNDAVETAQAEVANLQPLSHIIEPVLGLPTMLFTPIQRIMRYPMLLKSLLKYTPEIWPHHVELVQAEEAMGKMMSDVNEMKRKADNKSVTRDLDSRIKDWRHLSLPELGELHLSGTFPILNISHPSGEEFEYSLYLFDRLLLCCRERAQNHKKSTLTKMRPSGASVSSRNSQGRSLTLDIRGRIFMAYVKNVSYAKAPGSGYFLQLNWGQKNNANEHGAIRIKLINEEQAQKWEQTIIMLVTKASQEQISPLPGHAGSGGHSSNAYQHSNSTANLSSGNSPLSYNYKQAAAQSYTAFPSVSSPTPVLVQSTNASYRISFRKSHGGTSRRASSSSITRIPSDEVNFWEDSPSPTPIEALRKMSVSSVSSQSSRSSLQLPSQGNGSSGNPPFMVASSGSTRVSRQKSESSVSVSNGMRHIRLYVGTDSFIIMMPPDTRYELFAQKVERKLKLTGQIAQDTPFSAVRMEYLDEDNDRVKLESEEDMQMAYDAVPDNEELSIVVNVNGR